MYVEIGIVQNRQTCFQLLPLGIFRAVYLVALCCVGSFLFAYDTGIVGGVLTFPSFQNDFRYGKREKTTVNSNANSLLQAGGTFYIEELIG